MMEGNGKGLMKTKQCSKFNKFTSRNIFKTQENCKKCAHTGCHECQDTETEYRVEGKKMSGESGGVR